ncbi:MAG: hypothetical protein EOR16_15745 [Mesorhizobium sp.]|nr:transporter [Mesorhizobium sp.]RWI57048.1 MAG: hypothetical protein EOR16_15745 [Mesorhizobium sp.]
MLAPGFFVQAGVGLNLPTGKYDPKPGSVNIGLNAFAADFNVGVS